MTLEEFRATLKMMTPAEYESQYGEGLMDGAKPNDMVRCYESGCWILYRAATGDHWMHLETEEYGSDDGYSLPELEDTLYRYSRPWDQEDHA